MSNYTKLKTNLKLAITRLKLLEKKKSRHLYFLITRLNNYINLNKLSKIISRTLFKVTQRNRRLFGHKQVRSSSH